MLGVYTPGTTFEMYGNDWREAAQRRQQSVYQLQYPLTPPPGKPEKNHSELALWFQSAPPKHQLFRAPSAVATILANGRELLTDDPGTKAEAPTSRIPPIPPYAENYELIGVTAFTVPMTIYQFQPHAQYGQGFQVRHRVPGRP